MKANSSWQQCHLKEYDVKCGTVLPAVPFIYKYPFVSFEAFLKFQAAQTTMTHAQVLCQVMQTS